MARLGEFGAAQRELGGEKDDFVFCGEEFTVEQHMPAVLMLQLGAATTGKVDETEGFAAIWEALRCSLTVPAHTEPDGTCRTCGGPPGWDEQVPAEIRHQGEGGHQYLPARREVEADPAPFLRLYKLAVDNGVELDALMRLVFALFEVQGGRPTQQASASSAGPVITSPSSSVSSTPAAPSHLRSVDDLVRDGRTIVLPDSNTIEMGDGQLVRLVPTEQTG